MEGFSILLFGLGFLAVLVGPALLWLHIQEKLYERGVEERRAERARQQELSDGASADLAALAVVVGSESGSSGGDGGGGSSSGGSSDSSSA